MSNFTTWRSLVDGEEVGGIPDSGVFQDSQVQWWAGEGIDVDDGQQTSGWQDVLLDATATDVGAPTFRADQAGFPAVEYDGVDDGHDFPSFSGIPTGSDPISFAATVYLPSLQSSTLFGYGNDTTNEAHEFRFEDDGNVRWGHWSGTVASGGDYPTGEWITTGGRTDGDTVTVFLNGTNVSSDTGATANVPDENRGFGYRSVGGRTEAYKDGFINEILVSNGAESDQAFEDYHNDRLG